MGKRRHRPPVPRNSRVRSPSSRRHTVSQARPMVVDRGAGPAGNAAAGRARRPALAPSRGAWCAGGRPRPAALAAAHGAAGRPRPTTRGAGRGGADAAGRAHPLEQRPYRAADWAWRPPQAAVPVAQRPTRPTAREAAAVTTTRLAMPEPVVQKAPLPPKSEYCGSSFHRFRTFWNGSANCVPTKMRFYVEHFLFSFVHWRLPLIWWNAITLLPFTLLGLGFMV